MLDNNHWTTISWIMGLSCIGAVLLTAWLARSRR